MVLCRRDLRETSCRRLRSRFLSLTGVLPRATGDGSEKAGWRQLRHESADNDTGIGAAVLDDSRQVCSIHDSMNI